MTLAQHSSSFLVMTLTEHPNLTRLRMARIGLDMAERLFRAEVVRTMAERRAEEDRHLYTATAVAKAANVSPARVYQILKEQKARATA